MVFHFNRSVALLLAVLLVPLACRRDPDNFPPVIESILLDPAGDFVPGYEIAVTAIATDKDGDPLSYLWESDGGAVTRPDEQTTSWEIFTTAEPLSYESIRVTVSDGKESVSLSKTIQISPGLTVSGFACFRGTSIPVEGVEVTIGKYTTLSGEDGSYTIRSLREGYHIVRALKEGFDLFETSEYVDNPTSVFNIPLTSGLCTGQLSGIVKTADGITFEGLSVTLLNPDHSESDLYAITGTDGSFEVEEVPFGSRMFLVRNQRPETHFLNDSLVFSVDLDSGGSHDIRIKTLRTIFFDSYLSAQEIWNVEGSISDGFYLLGKGHQLSLRDFIMVPQDAERALFYLNSYIIGGCNLVGKLPSHRVWISNLEGEYLGGISWGGEGSNFPARVSWYPSDSPTFLNIYGRQIKLHFELFSENSCLPDPLWRVYEVGFSYYH
jgi:hypothetical protein